MSDLLYYSGMALMIFFVLLIILRFAEGYKSYVTSLNPKTKPKLEATKPLRSQRAQEIWNRLNPKIYLDDDETEPLPQKRVRAKIKPN